MMIRNAFLWSAVPLLIGVMTLSARWRQSR
jgi:hypothetical protein